MNQSHLAKNGLQCVSNRGIIWSTSVTNSAFLLAFVTTPIDSAHSMYYAYRPCAFCSCAYGLVEVVKNANGTRLAGCYPQTSVGIGCRERFGDVLADITKSPYIIQSGAYGVYKSLIQPSNNKSRPIDCAMCVRGMCSIEL